MSRGCLRLPTAAIVGEAKVIDESAAAASLAGALRYIYHPVASDSL